MDSKIYELNYNNGIEIISAEPISDQSYEYYGLYYTKTNLDDFDDIIQETLYANYKEKIFPISYVSKNFEQFRLDGTKISSEDAKKYEFVYDRDYGQYYLDVSINDIEILSKTTSILENLKKNNLEKKTK